MCRNRRRADRWRYSRPACSDISTSVPRSREYDVGGDREPEGVIADNLYLDEHANDRKDHQHERKHKPKVHCAYLLALRRNAKNLAWSVATGNVRDLVAGSKATSEICGPRSMLSHSQSACAFACGVVLDWKIVMLDWTMNAVSTPDVRLKPLC